MAGRRPVGNHLDTAETVLAVVLNSETPDVEEQIATWQQIQTETLMDIAYSLRRIVAHLENGGQR